TGEIFRADIVIDANLARFGHNEQQDLVDPTTSMAGMQRYACALSDCDYGYGAYQQASWAALAMSMDSKSGAGGQPPERYVDTFLTSLVLHESGHNLGLRHNFAASTVYSHADLHN